jgi:diguanylate cyclase (GGDEF)-like protein
MQAAVHASWLETRTGRAGRLVASARALPARIRATDYVTVGADRGFRAVQRRRTRSAASVGFLVIGAAAFMDGLVLVDQPSIRVLPRLVLNGAVVMLALGGRWQLGRRLRRYPDPVASVVTLGLTAATAATGATLSSLAVESAAYLLLIPVLVTLILPWSTRTHLRWLVCFSVIAMGYLAFAGSTSLSAADRSDLVVVMLIAIGASLAGHGLLQRASIQNYRQVRKIELLHRRAGADMQELARVHKALEETARTDPLTGARNRLRLAEDLRGARARMNRLGVAHGLIAFDLDRFKAVNDELGHLAGDEVLKAVVTAVRRTIRADDEVYRFGGEEFLVVVRVVDVVGAHAAAERLRRAIEDLAIELPANVPHGRVTASLGVTFVTAADLGATDDDWFALADAALYRAKARGRNRVEMAAA